jgi:hypothetical protein
MNAMANSAQRELTMEGPKASVFGLVGTKLRAELEDARDQPLPELIRHLDEQKCQKSNDSPTEPSSHDAPKQWQPLHPVLINAFLHVRGGRCRIEITDYSQHGLSLDRATGVELDERVTVELQSGRRLPMRVAWVRGTAAGVRFLGPIVSEHAVMRWLDEAVKMKHRRSL